MEHQFHLLNFTLNRELSEIYLSIIIRTLALSMVGIFIPLYLLIEIGFPLKIVLLYFIVEYIFTTLFFPFTAKISSKIGFKHSILLSIPILMISIALFYFLKNYNHIWFLSVIAIVIAFGQALFWLAFHEDFAKFSDKKHRGEEVSIWFSSSVLISLIGPFLGSLIIISLGFNILFIIVSILMLGSAIPLFFSGEVYEPYKFSFKHVFNKSHFKDMLAFIGFGARNSGINVIWPIFIFLILNQYLSIGLVFSVAGFFVAIFTFLSGKLADLVNKMILIRISSIIELVIWIFKAFVTNFWQIFILTILGSIFFRTTDVPFTARTYDKANKGNRVEYLIFRESSINIGRILVLLIAMISLKIGILSTALGILLHIFF